ncbi:hypothetical protein [Pseudomonas kurunegalensis]|uniref:hypothetical protein n=1 Tax=Pseudomonas kurunegalensis TaxID=485880 RepID=UPI0023633AAA|nr:hypothetical protein [Pseudomonas kurunegalensis]MDD2133376.1 hypothetical protein [Pseudomonas kurunegalensis]
MQIPSQTTGKASGQAPSQALEQSTCTSSPMVAWRPGNPIPFAEYEDERDYPPEELTADDVQQIWWCVAAGHSRDELHERLLPAIEAHKDWGCFVFNPIAELAGRCRYPWPVLDLLKDILPPEAMIAVAEEQVGGEEESEGCRVVGMMIIQVDIWHELIWQAFDICPPDSLSKDLLEIRLGRDLGL